jgi:BRCT domain type II-containing protein
MHMFIFHCEKKFLVKHDDVSKKVRVRPNQSFSRKRARRSQQGVIANAKKRNKEEHFSHPKNFELLTEL